MSAITRRTCERKRKYDRKRALTAASQARKLTGDDIQAYRCWYCRDWHIGHSSIADGRAS